MVWHNITCQEEGLNVFNFPNMASLLRVSRVAGDSFQRESLMYHPCQSPSMTQTNIQYHSGTVTVHHHGVAYHNLPGRGAQHVQFSKYDLTSESVKSGRGLLPTQNTQAPPLSEPIHDPHNHTIPLRNSGSPSSWCGIT